MKNAKKIILIIKESKWKMPKKGSEKYKRITTKKIICRKGIEVNKETKTNFLF